MPPTTVALSGPVDPFWSVERLRRIRQGARYFGLANLYRGLLYVPPMAGFALALPTAGGWTAATIGVLGLLGALVAFHGLCAFLEAYKWVLAGWLAPRATPGAAEDGPRRASEEADELARVEAVLQSLEQPRSLGDKFFRPSRFDRDWARRVTLVGLCQKCTVAYIQSTRLNRRERRAGERVEFLESPSVGELLRFERETRTGEAMHLAAAALNLPGLIVGLGLGAWIWAGWFFVVAFCDTHLGLLQRQHRIRVGRALAAFAKRSRRGKAGAGREPLETAPTN
ncbi:MAG: hypothetical protein SNJ74_06495 [Fimbriimonadaceae bacterium]